MRPRIIIHAQTSLDGCNRGFIDTGIYYQTANEFNANMVLFGSDTVELAVRNIPPETKSAFEKPLDSPSDKRPIWIIPDSRGKLRNLHVFRNTEYCKDIILLVSKTTPHEYLDYLKERNYDFIVAGEDHVDYKEAFEILYNQFECKALRTDSGGKLINILLEQGLADEICLIISPCLVGASTPTVFRSLNICNRIDLKLKQSRVIDNNYLVVNFEIVH